MRKREAELLHQAEEQAVALQKQFAEVKAAFERAIAELKKKLSTLREQSQAERDEHAAELRRLAEDEAHTIAELDTKHKADLDAIKREMIAQEAKFDGWR